MLSQSQTQTQTQTQWKSLAKHCILILDVTRVKMKKKSKKKSDVRRKRMTKVGAKIAVCTDTPPPYSDFYYLILTLASTFRVGLTVFFIFVEFSSILGFLFIYLHFSIFPPSPLDGVKCIQHVQKKLHLFLTVLD